MIHTSLDLITPLLLYAETHFRFFRGFPSFLYQKDPEILFDCPRRVGPEKDIPILLLINDQNKLEVSVIEIQIAISKPGLPIKLFNFTNLNHFEIQHDFIDFQKAFLFYLDRNLIPNGEIFINCKATVNINGHKKEILNDNLLTSSKAAFSCFITNETLPGKPYVFYGDLHFHSQYSQSHVEFGPPILAVDVIAKASGLDFLAITDHSYDLACKMDNYLVEDQSGKRWKSFQKQFKSTNFSTLFFPGEEISCINEYGNVVHLCGIGLSKYIQGSIDGARKKKVFTSQLTIKQSIDEIHRQDGLTFAAHPGVKKSTLQSVFLNRGVWTQNDICQNNLNGIQPFNGSFKGAWDRGKLLWIKALMKGQKLPIVAGNDAHGDFNRYRAIRVPFFSILENFDRYMGFGKTGVYNCKCTYEEILLAIRNGKTFITTGPYLSICFSNNPSDNAISNSPIQKNVHELFLHAISSEEFGILYKLAVYGFKKSSNDEFVLFSKIFENKSFDACEHFSIQDLNDIIYIRAETLSRKDDSTFCKAFTSPCYF